MPASSCRRTTRPSPARSRSTSIGQPAGTVRLSPVPPVTFVRYFAPPDVTPVTDTFTAEIDLSGVDPQAGTSSVPVTVRSIDPRITVLSSEPAYVSVRLEDVETKVVPVKVALGPQATGLELGETTVDPDERHRVRSGVPDRPGRLCPGRRRHRPGRPGLRPGRAADRGRRRRERGPADRGLASHRPGDDPGLHRPGQPVGHGDAGRDRNASRGLRDRFGRGRAAPS